MRRVTLLSISLAAIVVFSACGESQQSRRYSRKQAQGALSKLEEPGLLIGEFGLSSDSVVDGDTIKVKGLDSSLRLLAIDTEETFKREKRRRASEASFEQYLTDMRAEKKYPKMGTPMGEEAKVWAKKFFEGVEKIRLERDHPKDIRGRFNRYLSYVFALKGGQWVNYNVECVRSGMSPYFTKYGYSRRFHDEFVQAEKEARAANRGIWDVTTKNYRDYPARKKWWNARGTFVRQFEADAQGQANYITLTHWDALSRLEQNVGKQVTVLATVGDIILGDKGPTRVNLSRRMFGDVPVIFWDKDIFRATGLADYRGEFVRVTGTVGEYTNKHTGRRTLQVQVDRPSAVMLSRIPGKEVPDYVAARFNDGPSAAAPRERCPEGQVRGPEGRCGVLGGVRGGGLGGGTDNNDKKVDLDAPENDTGPKKKKKKRERPTEYGPEGPVSNN